MLLDGQADPQIDRSTSSWTQSEGQAGKATKMSAIPRGVSCPHPLLTPLDSEHGFISKHHRNHAIGSVVTDKHTNRLIVSSEVPAINMSCVRYDPPARWSPSLVPWALRRPQPGCWPTVCTCVKISVQGQRGPESPPTHWHGAAAAPVWASSVADIN